MTITIDHALRAYHALRALVRHDVADYLRYRKGRGKLPNYARACLELAKLNGVSLRYFRQLTEAEFARLIGPPDAGK